MICRNFVSKKQSLQIKAYCFVHNMYIYKCDQIYQKGVCTCVRSFNTEFSAPFINYINRPTAHVCDIPNIKQCALFGLHSQACLTSISAWVVFKELWWDLLDNHPAVNYHMGC